jgi:acetyl esterase/lipase
MGKAWRRRAFLGASIAGTFGARAAAQRGLLADQFTRETFTYKTVGELSIKADVSRSSSEKRRPVAVWIHGGALIMGDRRGIDRALAGDLINAGYVVVSIDYRLAPETKLPAILEDVRDAIAWVRKDGPRLFGAEPDRIVVLGGSAGGYLTLMSGFEIEPRPMALVSYWGYGDIAGEWYSRPDEFYRRQPLVSEDEARAAVGTKALAEPPPSNKRGRFYLYCRQNGLWTKEVAGLDALKKPKALDPFCPIRNVTKEYPPTMLIHGTIDTDVPHEQSVQMDRELARHQVLHEFISVPGGGHGLGGMDRARLAEIRERVIAFLSRHLA